MSWDQPAYSFGDPNAQPPPTPTSATSAHFPSPTLRTPNNNNTNFDNRTGWTPTFAEDYSVFFPGRLTSAQHFVDTSTPRPAVSPVQHRRWSVAESIEVEPISHDHHHLSPDVAFSQSRGGQTSQLASSPASYATAQSRLDESSNDTVTPRGPRKRLEEAFSAQTATPPASSKGGRKMAQNPMQYENDPEEGHYGPAQTPTQDQQNFLSYGSSTSPQFFFGSTAPASAPVFTPFKPFWANDTSMSGMDVDFATHDGFATNNMTANFQSNNVSHSADNSADWGSNNQMFQDVASLSAQNHNPTRQPGKSATTKRHRPLAPKATTTKSEAPSSLPPFSFHDATSAPEDNFIATTSAGTVDPNLFFSRTSTVMSSGFEDVEMPATRPSTSHLEAGPYQHQRAEAMRDEEDLRLARMSRSSSSGARRPSRETVSSPVKASARPGLHRSISDSRNKRSQGRINSEFGSRGGHISPAKHHRSNNLRMIPELPSSRGRAEVRFVIDGNGHARTETVFPHDQQMTTPGGPSSTSEDEYPPGEESSDDEPIPLAPSRSASFSLLQPAGGLKLMTFATGHGAERQSSSGQSTTSSQRSLRHSSVGSEAETVLEGEHSPDDAVVAMRKLMQDRKVSQLQPRNRHHRIVTRNTNYNSSTAISPVIIDAATPSSTRSGTTRCVCSNPDSEGFMIQCESCDNWLHAECVGIDRRSLPPVYICAYCAQTPNVRGRRNRGPANALASPLARKSFRSFR